MARRKKTTASGIASIRESVIAFLSKNPNSRKSDIVKGTGLNPNTLSNQLQKMKADSLIEVAGSRKHARWSLTDENETVAAVAETKTKPVKTKVKTDPRRPRIIPARTIRLDDDTTIYRPTIQTAVKVLGSMESLSNAQVVWTEKNRRHTLIRRNGKITLTIG